jgi:hypothetical protein
MSPSPRPTQRRSTPFTPPRWPPVGKGNCPPGERPYAGYYYAAFLLDPDGHNVEVVFRGDESRR